MFEKMANIFGIADNDKLFSEMREIVEWIVYCQTRGRRIVALTEEDYEKVRKSSVNLQLRQIIKSGNENEALHLTD